MMPADHFIIVKLMKAQSCHALLKLSLQDPINDVPKTISDG